MNERKFSINSRETEQLTTASFSYVYYESLIQNEEPEEKKLHAEHKFDNSEIFTSAIPVINSFLEPDEHTNLKATCRFFYNKLDTVGLTAEQLIYFAGKLRIYPWARSTFAKLEALKKEVLAMVTRSAKVSLKSLNCVLGSEHQLPALLKMENVQLKNLKEKIYRIKLNKGKNCIPVGIRSCTSNSCFIARERDPDCWQASGPITAPLTCAVFQSCSSCVLASVGWTVVSALSGFSNARCVCTIPPPDCCYCSTVAMKLTASISGGVGALTGCITGAICCYNHGTQNVERNAQNALNLIDSLLHLQNIDRVISKLENPESRTLSI